MNKEKKLIAENKILKVEIENMKKRQFNQKEYFLKEIARMFGEESHTIEKYKYKDEEKSYEKLNDFYDALGRISKDKLIDLIEKIKKYREAHKNVTEDKNG